MIIKCMDSPTILVIEDTAELRELIVTMLYSEFQANVLEADSVKMALDILGTQPNLSCVFSDYDLLDGKSYDVYLALQKINPNIPFILCTGSELQETHFTEKDKLAGVIVKPFQSRDAINAVRNALNSFRKSQDLTVYMPIKLKSIQAVGNVDCELFVKLSDTKYVKINNAGQLFTREDVDKYLGKKIDCVYVNSADSNNFLDKLIKDVISVDRAKSLPQEEGMLLTAQAHETLHSLVSNLGVSESAINLAEACTKMALASITHEPALGAYIKKITQDKDSYLSAHSTFLSHLTCILASLFGWTSETTQYKLAFSAIVHDLTLQDNSTAMVELTLLKGRTPQLEKALADPKFRDHGNHITELLFKMNHVPADVDLILAAHHERPDGTGFPRQLKASQLGPLPSVFIIAHDITNHLWLNGLNADLSSFVEVHKKDYKVGVFAKFIDSYKSDSERLLDRFLE